MNKQNHTLQIEECIALKQLLESGFTLQDAITILYDKNNKEIFDSLVKRLNNGESITAFFHFYCPKKYQPLFESFIQCMPFLESLSTCIEIVQAEDKNRKEMIHGMFYPTMLFVGVIVGVYLFNELILPNMIGLLAGFQIQSNQYVLLQSIIRYSIRFLCMVVIFTGFMVLFLFQKKQIVRSYQLISQYFPNGIFVQTISSQFARFFLECQKRNISTKDTLEILMHVHEQPCVSYIASILHQHLLKGETMMQALLETHIEKTLLRFFRIAIISSNCEEMLEGYLEMVQLKKVIAIKRFSRYIQLLSYSLIGVVMIFVYQILMVPMTMLQNL